MATVALHTQKEESESGLCFKPLFKEGPGFMYKREGR